MRLHLSRKKILGAMVTHFERNRAREIYCFYDGYSGRSEISKPINIPKYFSDAPKHFVQVIWLPFRGYLVHQFKSPDRWSFMYQSFPSRFIVFVSGDDLVHRFKSSDQWSFMYQSIPEPYLYPDRHSLSR